MIWRASLKLLLLSLLFLAGQPGAGAAQPWNPFLGDQPTQHAILGHVAGLGPVLGPNGEQDIVEYDAQGGEVRTIPYQPGMFILSVDAWNAEVAQWNAAVQAAGEGNAEALRFEAYAPRTEPGSQVCYDLSAGAAAPAPPVPDGVKWVLVKKVAQGLPACSEYLLELSTLDPPDAPISGGSALIVDGNRDVVATSAEGNTFAFESAYFEPQAGLCPENPSIPSPVLRNLVAYQACRSAQVAKIWAPIWGVPLDTTQGLAFVPAVSNENGFFRLDYTSHGFDDESGTWVWGEVLLDAFNPRFPSSRKFYLKRRATGAGTVRSANFAMDLVQASVGAVLLNPPDPPRAAQDSERPPEIPIVDPDYQFDEFTEYEYSDPGFDGVEPGYSFENLPEVDFRHLGLVEQISAIDLQATDVYLYRVSDGKLIGARRGLTPSNLVGITADPLQFPRAETPSGCEDNACIGLVLLTRGPASRATAEDAASLGGTAPYQSAVISAGGSPNQVSLELEYLESEPAVDFLRPGDTVQVVAVNRVTGYLGSALGRLQNRASGQLGVVNEGGGFGLIIAMLPPNLRIQAKRTFDIEAGQTSGGPPREYVIGFEGASLNTDTIVEITTTWVDHDGKPLPSDLAGFTGRLASVMDDELEGEGDAADSVDGLGHFSIRPGTHTQVARVPVERVDVGHLYLHIDAAPSDETVDFENALIDRQPSFAVNEVCYGSGDNCFPKPQGDGSNPLEQRPAHFVPFLVPMFDEAATRAATVAQRQELQDAWNEGDTLPILEKVDPIYEWVYRPEFKFAVLDLDVKGTDIVTDDQGTRLVVDYTLVGGDDTQQLDPLGDNEFVFSLGYAELLATVLTDLASGEISQAEFDDIASLLAMTSGGQLGPQADALGAILGPEDFLVLQLYLQHDSYNGLYEFAFGSDLNVFGDARTLEMERVHRRARYEHHGGLPQVPAYADTYEFLSFETKYESSVDVFVIDASGTPSPLISRPDLPAGRHRFVIDYETLSNAGITPELSPTFTLEIRTTYLDGSKHSIVYDGFIREREQGKVVGQTVVSDVAIADGSLRLEREDFRVTGKGPDLAFVRSYSSTNVSEGSMGHGWRHQFGHKLIPIEAGDPTSTASQPAAIPDWVRTLRNQGIFGTTEQPPVSNEWIEVLVNGTRFRKYGTEWYSERGRHGSLVEESGYLVFVAMDGTRYRYRVPKLPGVDDSGFGSTEDVPVTVADAAVYRIGLPPLDVDCLLEEPVVDIEAPNGYRLDFVYGQDPDAETVGRCGELVTIKEVDGRGALEGRKMMFSYRSIPLLHPTSGDPDGLARRLKQVTGPGGILVSFDYDDQGRLTGATRSTLTEVYEYPPGIRDAYITAAEVNPAPNPAQRYEYRYHTDVPLDLAGSQFGKWLKLEQIVKQVVLPTAVLAPSEPPGPSTVDFVYDFSANNTRQVVDARGHQTNYTLDDVGRPLFIMGPLGRYTELHWDAESGYTELRIERTDFGDRTSAYEYEFENPQRKDRLKRIKETWSLESGDETRETVFDARYNKPEYRRDRNRWHENWTYDADGNLLTHTDGEDKTWTYAYDPATRLLLTQTAPRRPPTHFTHDANGYVEQIITPLGHTTTTIYDARGRLERRWDELQRPTYYGYDDLDNLTSIQRPPLATIASARGEAIFNRNEGFQQIQTLDWDPLGRKLSETDHNGLILAYEHDGRGLVTRTTRNASTPFEGEGAARTFLYDANGNLKIETDWKGVETKHDYNELGQRVLTTNRLNEQMSYTYDPVGNLRAVVDFNDSTTTYTYDILGRRLSMSVQDKNGADGAYVTWTYYKEDDPETNLKSKTVHRDPYSPVTTEFRINKRYQRTKRINPGANGEYSWGYRDDRTLLYEEDEEGLRTEFRYDDDGRRRFQDVVWGGGENLVTEFEYSAVGNVVKVIDPMGRVEARGYDEWNRMVNSRVQYLGGEHTTEFLHDGEGNVINVHDPLGHDRSTLRDPLGRVTKTIAGDGAEVEFSYDLNGNVENELRSISDRSGGTGLADIRTHFTYDAKDRELCRYEAAGTSEERDRCVLEYDGAGNPLQVMGLNDEVTVYAYDANNKRIRADLPGGNDYLEWKYSRNGLLEWREDARRKRTNFAYDELDRLSTTTDPGGIYQESRTYTNVGKLLTLTDRRNILTSYEYDGLHRVRRVLRAGAVVAVYGYDEVGNVSFEQDGNCDRIDYCYEERNLRTHTYFPLGDSLGGLSCEEGGTSRSLNGCDHAVGAKYIEDKYDAAGNAEVRTNEVFQQTVFGHDPENRLISQAFAGEEASFTYDEAGLLKMRTQANGHVDTYFYDRLGNPVEVQDGGLLTTTYQYDEAGNRTHTILPSGATTEYVYDDRNRLEQQIQDPGGLDLTTTFLLDPNGNVDQMTDAKGQVIDYDYDDKNRRIRAAYPAQPDAPFYAIQSIDWQYDGNDNVKRVEMEKIDPAQSPPASFIDVTELDYTSRDSLLKSTQRGYSVHYTYDGANQQTGVGVGVAVVPGGDASTGYKYDARGRVAEVTTSGGTTLYTYFDDGRVDDVSHPNGVVTDYQYNAQNRVSSIEHSAGGSQLANYAYTYDAAGNRLTQVTQQLEQGVATQRTRRMAYDAAERLCAVAEGEGTLLGATLSDCLGAGGDLTGVEETRYAFNGYNRDRETVLVGGLATSGKVYDYDPANRLTTVDVTDGQSTTLSTLTYGYDNNGNTLSVTDSTAPSETMGFVYNPRDQLVRVTRGPPGSEVILGRYDYDEQGQRIRSEALGDLTELVYDGISLLQSYKGGTEDAFVHRGPDGELLGTTAPATPMQWVHTDVLGSPIVRTDDIGAVVATTRYGVFGDVASREDLGASQGPRFGFTGHQYDAGTELVYANARYYQPGIGRFLTQDPFLGDPERPASIHRYLYAAHSPAVLVDPTGNFPWTERRVEALDQRQAERDDVASDLIAAHSRALLSEGDEARASQRLDELISQNRDDAAVRMFWEAADGVLDIVAALVLFTNDAERKRSARRALDRVIGLGRYLNHEVYPAMVFADQTLEDLIGASEYFLALKERSESGDPRAVYEFAKIQTKLELELVTATVPPVRGLKAKPGLKGGGKAGPDVPSATPGGAIGRPRGLLDDIVDEANEVAAPNGAILEAQREALRANLPRIQRRSPFQNEVARREFVQRQSDLIAEWEAQTGRAWPVSATASPATPHHIIPLTSGGANAWWNLVPTHGTTPNHSLPGIPGPHSRGGVLRSTIQRGPRALPPGTVTDVTKPR